MKARGCGQPVQQVGNGKSPAPQISSIPGENCGDFVTGAGVIAESPAFSVVSGRNSLLAFLAVVAMANDCNAGPEKRNQISKLMHRLPGSESILFAPAFIHLDDRQPHAFEIFAGRCSFDAQLPLHLFQRHALGFGHQSFSPRGAGAPSCRRKTRRHTPAERR